MKVGKERASGFAKSKVAVHRTQCVARRNSLGHGIEGLPTTVQEPVTARRSCSSDAFHYAGELTAFNIEAPYLIPKSKR